MVELTQRSLRVKPGFGSFRGAGWGAGAGFSGLFAGGGQQIAVDGASRCLCDWGETVKGPRVRSPLGVGRFGLDTVSEVLAPASQFFDDPH